MKAMIISALLGSLGASPVVHFSEDELIVERKEFTGNEASILLESLLGFSVHPEQFIEATQSDQNFIVWGKQKHYTSISFTSRATRVHSSLCKRYLHSYWLEKENGNVEMANHRIYTQYKLLNENCGGNEAWVEAYGAINEQHAQSLMLEVKSWFAGINDPEFCSLHAINSLTPCQQIIDQLKTTSFDRLEWIKLSTKDQYFHESKIFQLKLKTDHGRGLLVSLSENAWWGEGYLINSIEITYPPMV